MMNFYHRQFTRVPGTDPDILADAQFLKDNFVDFFGQWLQQDENGAIDTLDGLLSAFWNKPGNQLQIFFVADGSFVTQRPADDWFNPHIRIIALAFTGSQPFTSDTSKWTLCIVGSRLLKESDRNKSFLQVASWNGLTFRFYQNDIVYSSQSLANDEQTQAWNYFGSSMDAFGANAYLGPFNGHVNGACIMKELHNPWLHWFTNNNFTSCFSDDDTALFESVPYLTAPDSTVLQGGAVLEASFLEIGISAGVTNWYRQRKKLDFFNPDGQTLATSPSNIPRWVSHLLLSTTINIIAAQASSTPEYDYDAPPDNFFDNQLLNSYGGELLELVSSTTFSFKQADYNSAVQSLGLALLQELPDPPPYPPGYVQFQAGTRTLGGGKETDETTQLAFMVAANLTEGEFPFNILQSSFEDSQGVGLMQKLTKREDKSFLGLFSTGTFYALMMVDFWNPIYSWRRGVLMQYMPQQTTFNGTAYDLETVFISNVKASSYVQSQALDSPEVQFLNLLEVDISVHQQNIANYLAAVYKNIRTPNGLLDYMTLAESRRRIYRPLPLDEFGFTLPYALNMQWNAPWYEMTSTGQIQPMPSRGVDFITAWTLTLAGDNPQIIPVFSTINSKASAGSAPLPISNLPPPSTLAVSCQRMTSASSDRPLQGCPYRVGGSPLNSRISFVASSSPSWTEDILTLFKSPYWLPANTRDSIGAGWISAMNYYGVSWNAATKKFDALQLDNYDHVKENAVTIFQHLSSRSMPITNDPTEYWPDDALETFAEWANNGFPQAKGDPCMPKVVISKAKALTTTMHVRKDLRNLTADELITYQSKLDDILKVGALNSKWQELGNLHGQWCLHYQEATFLWHRAYLRYVEGLIDFPIPYWNGFATDASDPNSPYAGIPAVFLQDQYIHPIDNTPRPNPLKYALSLNGLSKDGTSQFVTRDPTLVAGSSSPGWDSKINLFTLYHQQITNALSQSTYSAPEDFGVPWANIVNFGDDNPDSWYPNRTNFDGLFEQVHDNFHGWTGPDMADNSYTAFDPIFLSYHANMDRLAAKFIEANPNNQYTSGFPLQPFINQATDISYDDPRRYIYTTIGDMAKNTKALSYLYAPPACPDVFTPIPNAARNHAHGKALLAQPSGGHSTSLPPIVNLTSNKASSIETTKKKKVPIVLFENVSCTSSSYQIDVFASTATDLTPDPVRNPAFIGQVTRLGMGPLGGGTDGGGRCRKVGVTRLLDASRVLAGPGSGHEEQGEKKVEIRHVVTDLSTGKVVSAEECKALGGGFEGRVVWI